MPAQVASEVVHNMCVVGLTLCLCLFFFIRSRAKLKPARGFGSPAMQGGRGLQIPREFVEESTSGEVMSAIEGTQVRPELVGSAEPDVELPTEPMGLEAAATWGHTGPGRPHSQSNYSKIDVYRMSIDALVGPGACCSAKSSQAHALSQRSHLSQHASRISQSQTL